MLNLLILIDFLTFNYYYYYYYYYYYNMNYNVFKKFLIMINYQNNKLFIDLYNS